MKRTVLNVGACVLALGLTGCNSQPIAKADSHVFIAMTSTVRHPIAEPVSFNLGAGDALGKRVFARAVAVARLENPDGWSLAAADESPWRAIYPSFIGRDASWAVEEMPLDAWAMLTRPAIGANRLLPEQATPTRVPTAVTAVDIVPLFPE